MECYDPDFGRVVMAPVRELSRRPAETSVFWFGALKIHPTARKSVGLSGVYLGRLVALERSKPETGLPEGTESAASVGL